MSGNWLMLGLVVALFGLAVSAVGSAPLAEEPNGPIPMTTAAPREQASEPRPVVPAVDLKAVVNGNNTFAIDLYKRLAEKNDGNIIISPYSVSSALAMAAVGARGKTAEEMAKVLHFTLPPERLHPAQAALERALRTEGGGGKPEFHVANALWGQKGLPFRDEFLRLTRDRYGASLREVDFAADKDSARRAINAWVGEQTRDKIRSILGRDDLSSDTRLVLTNAVYFKAEWEMPFSKHRTVDDTFRVSAERTVRVRMMKGRFHCRCVEADGIKVVVLPYRGATQSMVLVVPDDFDGLPAVERALSPDDVRAWLAGRGHDVRLDLPIFRARGRYSLTPVLGGMGMKLPFGPEGDFTGIADKPRLGIQGVVHEATVEVDEAGAEAAAATAGIAQRPIALKPRTIPRVLVVRADRPFLYMIVDNPSGVVLFVGRVVNP